MPRWHVLLCLSLLAENGDSSTSASTEIERRQEIEKAKDVFDDGLLLDFFKQKELIPTITPKRETRSYNKPNGKSSFTLKITKWGEMYHSKTKRM